MELVPNGTDAKRENFHICFDKIMILFHSRSMQRVLEIFLSFLPVWFGLFFLGPLIAEIIGLSFGITQVTIISSVSEISVYTITIPLGGAWGGLAIWRGRWI